MTSEDMNLTLLAPATLASTDLSRVAFPSSPRRTPSSSAVFDPIGDERGKGGGEAGDVSGRKGSSEKAEEEEDEDEADVPLPVAASSSSKAFGPTQQVREGSAGQHLSS